MPDERTCNQCGAPLPANAPANRCPKCLIQMALEESGSSAECAVCPPAPDLGAVSGAEAPGPGDDRVAEAPKKTIALPEPDMVVERTGMTIGRYKLLQQIGEGGFGEVFMAKQTEPVQRKVALKVVKAGMDTREVIARFEAERQALALMDHPNIAQVLDGGATTSGRPYFVMELVRGLPITDYCDHANLSTGERLDLFIKVCRAVQHAHQKGVIHRDLKPSNVLVTLHDGEPVPKVIDFGVAKALGQKLTEKTLFTRFEQMIGTPAYMSPEQAALGGLDIDTRSDIYSLGVLLYELLTGVTPLDEEALRQGALDEIRRMIRETDPPKPSTRLLALGDRLAEVAKHRHAEPAALSRLIRGDLDWITMKALEKDRQRRYETVNGLAMDVERHLNCEPVVARPPSRLYEFQKTVRRHKFGFAAAAALIAVLALGVLVSTFEAVRATRAEREQVRLRELAQAKEQTALANERKAQTEAAKSEQTAQFLKDMLQGVGPKVALGKDTKLLKEILDNTAARIGKDLKDQPEVQADLLLTIGGTYLQLFELDKAEALEREALRLRRLCFGATNRPVAASLNDLARVLNARRGADNLAEAEKDAREALSIWRTVAGEETQEAAVSLHLIASAMYNQNKTSEAETLYRECLVIRRKLFGSDHKDVASTLDNLGMVLLSQGQPVEAEEAVREALRIQQRVFGPEHPDVADSLINLGRVFQSESRLAEAEATYREALAMQRKLMGQDTPRLEDGIGRLVEVLKAERDSAALEALFRERLARQRALLGNDSPAVAETLLNLADSLQAQGKKSEAEKASAEALDISFTPNGRITAKTQPLIQRRAEALHLAGKSEEAEKLFELAIDAARRKLRETDPILGALHRDFGNFLIYREGKPGPAVEQYLKAEGIYRANTNEGRLTWTCRELGDALVRGGKPKEAQPYLRESLALYRKLHQGEDRWGTAYPNLVLGDALEQEHKLPEAEQAYRDALTAYAKCQALGDENHTRAVRSLLRVLKQENKLAQAEALCRELVTLARQLTEANPKSSDSVVQLGHNQWQLADALAKSGRHAEAEPILREGLKVFEKAATNFPAEPFMKQEQACSYRLLADLLGELRRTDEAERGYREAIRIYAGLAADAPQNAFYRQEEAYSTWMLAALLESGDRLDSAEAAYRCAVALHENASAKFPKEAVLTERLAAVELRLAELYVRLGRTNEATATFERIIQLATNKADAYWRRAFFHERNGDYEKAILDFEMAVKLKPDSADFNRQLAWNYARYPGKFRSPEKALPFALKAVELSRTNATELNTLGMVYLELGQLTDAIATLSKAIERNRGATAPLYWRARVYEKMGDYEKSFADYEKIRTLEPESASGLNGLAWGYVTCPAKFRSPEKALPLALKAVELSKNAYAELNTLGVVYYRLGQWQKAVETLEAACKTDKDGGGSADFFFLAASHHQLGDAAKAGEFFAKATNRLRSHSDKLSKDSLDELESFRVEAEEVLGKVKSK